MEEEVANRIEMSGPCEVALIHTSEWIVRSA